MLKYLLALVAIVIFTLPVYAGGSHHHNSNAKAAAVATGGASSAVANYDGNNFVTGTPGGLSNGWTCSVSYSFSTVFFGWSWTDDSEICRLAFQKREVCADNPGSERCTALKDEVANWKPFVRVNAVDPAE